MTFRNVAKRSKTLQGEFDRWREKLRNCNTSTDAGFKDLENSLRANLRSVEAETKTLRSAVAAIEKNREQFAHIDDAELAERSRFVKEIKEVLKKIKGELDSQETSSKKKADLNAELNAVRIQTEERQKSRYSAMEEAEQAERSRQMSQLQARQEELFRGQDAILGSMNDALARLNTQALIINDEIKDQDM
jgi:hypothetical protein